MQSLACSMPKEANIYGVHPRAILLLAYLGFSKLEA